MNDDLAIKRRGRKPSGIPRNEIVNASQRKRVANLKKEGKKPLNSYVKEETLSSLDALKNSMELGTRGEVIEVLVDAEKMRRKLS